MPKKIPPEPDPGYYEADEHGVRRRRPGKVEYDLRQMILAGGKPEEVSGKFRSYFEQHKIPFDEADLSALQEALKPISGLRRAQLAKRVAKGFAVDFELNPDAYVGVKTVEDGRMLPYMCKECGLWKKWFEYGPKEGAEFTAGMATREALDIKDPRERMRRLKEIQAGIRERTHKDQVEWARVREEHGIPPTVLGFAREGAPHYARKGEPTQVDVSQQTPMHGLRPEKVCAVIKRTDLNALPVTGVGRGLDGPYIIADGQHRVVVRALMKNAPGRTHMLEPEAAKYSKFRGKITVEPLAFSGYPEAKRATDTLASNPDKIFNIATPSNPLLGSAVSKPPEPTFRDLIERDLLGVNRCVGVRLRLPNIASTIADKQKALQANALKKKIAPKRRMRR